MRSATDLLPQAMGGGLVKYGLDLETGAKLWKQEIFGDWYRDPWEWPELAWVQAELKSFPVDDFLYKSGKRIALRYPPRFHPIAIPKTSLATRPAVVQDPLSRFVYLCSTGTLARSLHEFMSDSVFGWRFRGGTYPSNNTPEWQRYMEKIRTGEPEKHSLQTDITSFFASIDVDRLIDDMFQKRGDVAIVHLFEDIVRAHDNLQSRRGLPQRSFGSALIANYYLHPLDDMLDIRSEGHTVPVWTRWMDDITMFGDDDALYKTFLEMQDIMRSIALEPNASKSSLVSADEAIRALDAEHEGPIEIRMLGGYDTDVEPDWDDFEKVQGLESRVLEQGSDVSRTFAKKALVSLRKNGLTDKAIEWCDNAQNIPHAADSLGRYLREAAALNEEDPDNSPLHWDELEEWLVDYLQQSWASLDWVKAQLALSIPTAKVTRKTEGLLTTWLQESNDIQLIAVAAQRLASIKPTDCRSIISERSDKIQDPLILRLFALAWLQARGTRRTAEQLIKRDPANNLLQKYMEACNWSPPDVSEDFEEGHRS